jgi:hypothetical protein
MKKKIFKSICTIILSVNLLFLTGCGQYADTDESIKSGIFKIIDDVSGKVSDVSSLIGDYSSNTDIEKTLAEAGKKKGRLIF